MSLLDTISQIASKVIRLERDIKEIRDKIQRAPNTALHFGGGVIVTPASGVLTVNPRTYYRVLSETGTSDDVDTITATHKGHTIILFPIPGHTITVKDNTGNIRLLNGDAVLDADHKSVTLLYSEVLGYWQETAPGAASASAIDHGALLGLIDVADHPGYVTLDGLRPLTGDWDIGVGRKLLLGRIDARNIDGIKLYDDGGNLVAHLRDGGNFGIGIVDPSGKLHVVGAADVIQAIVKANASQSVNLAEFQDSSGNAYVIIGPSVLPEDNSQHIFKVIGTMPSTPTGVVYGVLFDITSAGSASQTNRGVQIIYNAGYTGASPTVGLSVSNLVAGIAGNIIKSGTPDGNTGVSYATLGDTVGYNYGVAGFARKGNVSIGGVFRAGHSEAGTTNPKDGATYIGLLAVARNNTASGSKNIGAFIGLNTADPTFESAALIVDNDNATVPILLLKDNGATIFRVDDGGRVGIKVPVPQGPLHIHDGRAGFLNYSTAIPDGTAITVVPNGTGDVIYVVTGKFTVRASDGSTNSGDLVNNFTPGTSQNIYSSGSDIVTLAVAADGSITLQRTGGTLTYAVALQLVWL